MACRYRLEWWKMGHNPLEFDVPPRPTRSDISLLVQEARAIEMLMSEADITPDRLQDYWDLSADLIALVSEIEEFQREKPDAGYDDPTMFTLKHRLRGITSRLAEITAD